MGVACLLPAVVGVAGSPEDDRRQIAVVSGIGPEKKNPVHPAVCRPPMAPRCPLRDKDLGLSFFQGSLAQDYTISRI
jgi:hypothetical protein